MVISCADGSVKALAGSVVTVYMCSKESVTRIAVGMESICRKMDLLCERMRWNFGKRFTKCYVRSVTSVRSGDTDLDKSGREKGGTFRNAGTEKMMQIKWYQEIRNIEELWIIGRMNSTVKDFIEAIVEGRRKKRGRHQLIGYNKANNRYGKNQMFLRNPNN